MEDVLDYVNFSDKALVRNMENWVTRSVKEGKITLQEGKVYLRLFATSLSRAARIAGFHPMRSSRGLSR